MKSNRMRRKVLVTAALAVALTLVAVGAALAASVVLVDNAVTVNHGRFDSDHGLIKLKTKGPVRIRDVSSTAVPPGLVATWHTHPGPVIVAMTDTTPGALTLYDEECNATTIGHGQAYIEKPNSPVLVRNNSTANADWVTTLILPIGAPPATTVPPPCTP